MPDSGYLNVTGVNLETNESLGTLDFGMWKWGINSVPDKDIIGFPDFLRDIAIERSIASEYLDRITNVFAGLSIPAIVLGYMTYRWIRDSFRAHKALKNLNRDAESA